MCVSLISISNIVRLSARRPGETDEDWYVRQAAARKEVNQQLLTLVHSLVQCGTAVGLLQLLPLKPRTVGALGTLASAINCYTLLPAYPKRAATAAPAGKAAAPLPSAEGGKLIAKVA